MDFTLKNLEIVQFKSITNRVQMVDLSIDSNVVFVPFDSELSDDLIESIEYAFGKEIDARGAADVIITIIHENVTKILQRRGTPTNEHFEYEVNAQNVRNRKPIDKVAYLAALGLTDEQAIVINRNSSINELAASFNVTPFLERLCKSMDGMAELERAQPTNDICRVNKRNLQKYINVLRKCQLIWKHTLQRSYNLQDLMETQRRTLLQLETYEQNFVTESMYFDETGAVTYDAITNELDRTFNTQSLRRVDDANESLQNELNHAIADEMVEMDFRAFERTKLAEFVNNANAWNVNHGVISNHEMRAAEEETLVDSGPIESCHHHRELKMMQLDMSTKMDDYAFCLENIRSIIHKDKFEMPRRFYQLIESHACEIFGSIALGNFSRKMLARDEQHAIQTLTAFDSYKIRSIDVLLHVHLVQKKNTNAPEIPEKTWRLTSPKANIIPIEVIRIILGKYVVCDDEQNAAALTRQYPSRIVIVVANGTTLNNNLRWLEFGSNDAFNKSVHKIYCGANCIRFCAYAVAELPQFYPWASCLPLDIQNGNEDMPIGDALQEHQIKLHEQFVERIKSKWNAWQIFERKKRIEWIEIELSLPLFRYMSLHLKSTVNPFDVEREPHMGEVSDVLQEQKAALADMSKALRPLVKQLKVQKAHSDELHRNRAESFADFFRKLNDNIKTIFRRISSNPDAYLDFICADENQRHFGTIRYRCHNRPASGREVPDWNTNRYLVAIAIMLCTNETEKWSQLVVDDFGALLSGIELRAFLQYIFEWMKQKIIVLSKMHASVANIDRIFWLYRNYQDECEVLDQKALPE